MLGFTLVISNTIVGLQYLGLHLAAAGSYPVNDNYSNAFVYPLTPCTL